MATILVVEDDKACRETLTRMLEREGHDPIIPDTPAEALSMISDDPPDLVITDILMPDLDGIELITLAKKKQPGLRCIAISGGGRAPKELLLRAAKQLGAIESLQKPFERADLIRTINRSLAPC
jgi:DNA-binding NtrC family response regulator